ncbi:DinB family protein [Vibrio sp. TH_r3]|uniref:DinB family protein n=1 Tax=Vibrio sp. TH_r3 TaxID=3082084 RepID=UPI002953AEA7|nr:DinB family protein [Vibrio sp. TH_r3]MDV7103320.1 DinB family protein [Vibrio sp. TH_r3]
MNNQSTCPSVAGNLEAIEQSITLCDLLDSHSYTYRAAPYIQSSIGEHFRHILDMFFALAHFTQRGIIDYDLRRRGAPVESQLSVATEELKQVKTWLETLSLQQLDTPVTMLSEATIQTQTICKVPSSLRRELLFVASHTVHHLAIIKIITKHCGIKTDEQLGYAPATATYLRGQA